MILGSLRGRLVGSMTLLLGAGLAAVAALHLLERDRQALGLVPGHDVLRLLVGDELPEPWQDLAVLLPFSLVMLGLIGIVTAWSLRPLLRASQEAARAGPHDPSARIGTARLPSEIAPLVEAVNAALDRLGGAYENERRFTADAAHALRTPLAALGLRLQRGRRDGAAIDWSEVEADLATLRRLIEALLDLARKQAGGRSGNALNLSRAIREAAAGIEPLVREAGRELEVELPDQLWISGHADDLRDMVRNLAHNALVHGRGPIGLRLTRLPAAAADRDACAVIEVSDAGPGIPPAERARVFERFRKGAASASGSGLGLAIVRAVAEAHGGEASCADGPGCTLRVILPIREA